MAERDPLQPYETPFPAASGAAAQRIEQPESASAAAREAEVREAVAAESAADRARRISVPGGVRRDVSHYVRRAGDAAGSVMRYIRGFRSGTIGREDVEQQVGRFLRRKPAALAGVAAAGFLAGVLLFRKR